VVSLKWRTARNWIRFILTKTKLRDFHITNYTTLAEQVTGSDKSFSLPAYMISINLSTTFFLSRCLINTIRDLHFCYIQAKTVQTSLTLCCISMCLHCLICYILLLLRPRERLRSILMSASVCVSVLLCVCLSVRQEISGTTRAIFTNFLHVADVRGSVLLRHVDIRPHRLSAGRGWRECTARAKCNLRLPCFFLQPLRLSAFCHERNYSCSY